MDKPAVDLALQTAFQHRASQIGNDEKFTSLLVVRRPTIYNRYSANGRMMIMAEGQKKCVLAKACRAKTSLTHLKKGVNMSSIAVQSAQHFTCSTSFDAQRHVNLQ